MKIEFMGALPKLGLFQLKTMMTYNFQTDSDSLIVKGLLAILEDIFNGQNVKEICFDSNIILKR